MKPLYVSVLFLFSMMSSYAQWNTDSTVRNPVCTAPNSQYYPRSCSDGNGGAIFTWVDERDDANTPPTAYAQHFTKNGKITWAINGIPVSGNSYIVYSTIVSDGAGGAILIFETSVDGGANQLYAQHINSSGTLLWGSNGIRITDISDSRMRWAEDPDPEQDGISTDGSGGVFVTWQAYSATYDIYAQHISSSGNLVWGSTGVGLNGSSVYVSNIVSTGAGTAVVGYTGTVNYSLYLQRLAANGSYLWGSSGLLISSINYSQTVGVLAYDGTSSTPSVMAGFLTQQTPGFSNSIDVNVQKIDLNGNILWKAGGVNLTSNTSGVKASQPDIIPDNKGGLFAAYINGFTTSVQDVSSVGKPKWGASGTVVDNVPGANDANPVLVTDGSTGFITVFHTGREDEYEPIYAQHYNGAGTALWRAGGIPVIANHADIDHEVNNTVAATKGYAIVCWQDERVSGDDNIYTARIGGSNGFGTAAEAEADRQVIAKVNTSSASTADPIFVFPNPVTDVLHLGIHNLSGKALMAVYDLKGNQLKELSQDVTNGTIVSIPASQLAKGSYYIHVMVGNNSFTQRFLKE